MSPESAIGDARFAAIDFESAGATRGQTDVPVQIGIACWSPTAGCTESFVSFLHTTRPITWAARKVHGITPADLADAPPLLTLWPTIRRLLEGAVVVAHGKGTERRFLRAFPGHPFGPWLDTLLLARAAWPHLPSHALGDLCHHHQLAPTIDARSPGRTWHDALYDAAASLALLDHTITTFNLARRPLAVLLDPDTSTWHRLRR